MAFVVFDIMVIKITFCLLAYGQIARHSMSNRERQENELLALTSIYSSEELSTADFSRPSEIGSDELGGTFVAEVYFTPELVVTTAIEGKRHSVKRLPPLFLSFTMPNSYPSHRPPQFAIVSLWLNESQVKSLVSAELFERYDKLLLQNSLDTMPDVQYCPGRGCSYPVLVDKDAGLGMCPNCKYVFCVYCRKASHGINSCQSKTEAMKQIFDEYQKSDSAGKKALTRRYGKKVIASLLDEMSQKWIKDNSKLCPECKCKIEKTGGCHNMYCTKCNTYFCWLCLEVLHKDSSYAHFSDRATPCYNKLFFGVENEEPIFEEDDFVEAWNQEAEEEDGWDENWTDGMEDVFLDDPKIFNVLQSLE